MAYQKTQSVAVQEVRPLTIESCGVAYGLRVEVVSDRQGSVTLTNEQKQSLDLALKRLFPEQREENKLQKMRRIMGQDVDVLTDSELETCMSEAQFLIDYWMDEFEKKLFNNVTLKQLLRKG